MPDANWNWWWRIGKDEREAVADFIRTAPGDLVLRQEQRNSNITAPALIIDGGSAAVIRLEPERDASNDTPKGEKREPKP